MKCVVFICVLLFMLPGAQSQLPIPSIEGWREHLPYQAAVSVQGADQKIYTATNYSLFVIDLKENTIDRLSRISGLAETGVSRISYNQATSQLLVAYTNSNLDIISGNRIINIPGIKRSGITADKTINAIFPYNDHFILATGFGIVVVDGIKYEIKDTWFIGDNGGNVKVNGIYAAGNTYYAATASGLKRTVAGTNPADFRNWQTISGTSGLPAGDYRAVLATGNKLFTLVNDILFVNNGNAWSFFYADGWPITHINASGDQLLISQRKQNGDSRVLVLDTSANRLHIFQKPEVISSPQQAIRHNGSYWIADFFGGLSRFESATMYERFTLSSPQEIASGEMIAFDKKLVAAAGAVNDAWNYQYNGNGIYKFEAGKWNNYNRFNKNLPDSLLDFITLAIDPVDASVWAGSFGGGLLQLKPDNSYVIYKQHSPIKATIGDPGSYRVAGLAFDAGKNLWVSNFGAPQPLHVKKADGNWKSFTLPYNVNQQALAKIVIDDENQKWIISPLGNGLLVFNHGNDIDNTNDDRWYLYRQGLNNGNLPTSEVLSAAKDKFGFIWVGTTDGIGIIECPSLVFTPAGCPALLPVVQHGNFNGYLFKGEYVQSIAVDGANRKWVATRNGVFLVSESGEKLIYHFTENNSPLLSNDVKQVSIDGSSGEVFFATTKGIISYRGTATEPAAGSSNLLVFPNPVPPGFTGQIAIRGLVENALVKIIEPGGRLVYQTRAFGGQAIWNGRDYQGNKIASGAYIILVSDDNRQEKAVGKIFFISK